MIEVPDKTFYVFEKVAYGNKAIPQLVSEISLENQDYILALRSIVNQIHNPLNIYTSIKSGIIEALNKLIMEEDVETLRLSVEALAIISGNPTQLFDSANAIGKKPIAGYIKDKAINHLVSNDDYYVRKSLYTVLVNCTNQGLAELLPVLVEKAQSEVETNKCLVLECLYNCIRYGKKPFIPEEAMELDTLTILVSILQSSGVDAQIQAMRCITVLCFHPLAKQTACTSGYIGKLVRMLDVQKPKLSCAAVGTLMSITTEVEAKKIFVREDGVKHLIKMLESNDPTLLLNSIQTIANCSEDYRARFQFQVCIPRLEELKKIASVREAVDRAIAVLTWRP